MSKGMEITIGAQLAEILNEYEHALDETAKQEIQTIAKETSARLRSESPRKTGKYASGWRAKKNPDGTAVVYNAKRPSITYLLEYGHLIRNKNGTFGRAPAKPHIKPVEEWANEELVRRIESDIERGLT